MERRGWRAHSTRAGEAGSRRERGHTRPPPGCNVARALQRKKAKGSKKGRCKRAAHFVALASEVAWGWVTWVGPCTAVGCTCAGDVHTAPLWVSRVAWSTHSLGSWWEGGWGGAGPPRGLLVSALCPSQISTDWHSPSVPSNAYPGPQYAYDEGTGGVGALGVVGEGGLAGQH
jgi:hypothetical protein